MLQANTVTEVKITLFTIHHKVKPPKGLEVAKFVLRLVQSRGACKISKWCNN